MESSDPVIQNVETILRHEQDFLARRSLADRVGDSTAAIVGSPIFVVGQILFVAAWILVNSTHLFGVRRFDPPPFSLLDFILALESVLVASFIVMRQARISRRADQRDHLMLQILMLTEKELSAVIGMNRQIADKIGLGKLAADPNIQQLEKEVSIDDVADSIQQNLG